MKKFIVIPVFFTVFLLSFTAHAESVSRCIVAAGGAIAAEDTFVFTAAHIKDGSTRGSMQLDTPYGYTFQSNHLRQLDCTSGNSAEAEFSNSSQRIRFKGRGRWNGEDGFRITVVTEDRANLGDADHIRMRVTGRDGELVYRAAGDLVSGYVRHHSLNMEHP